MKSFLPNVSKKQLMIASGSIVLIILIALPFIVSQRKNHPTSGQLTQLTSVATLAPTAPPDKGLKPEASGTTTTLPDTQAEVTGPQITYAGSAYTVTIPEPWKPANTGFSGGSVLTFQPANNADYPIIAIESFDSSADLAFKESVFKSEGFAESTITMQNQQVTKLSGTLAGRGINGTFVQTPAQMRIVYLALPNALYVFKLYYNGDVVNRSYETIFNNTIATFVLH